MSSTLYAVDAGYKLLQLLSCNTLSGLDTSFTRGRMHESV
jgi:hypothetical protein